MRHFKFTAIVCAASLSALVTSAEDKIKLQADTRATADQTITSRSTHKANELIGMSLQNKTGEKLGTVRDLAFDASSSRLGYFIVASGGILGLGADFHAVPAKALSFDAANPKTLTIDVTKEKLQSSPKFKKDQLNTLAAQREQIDEHFKDAKDNDLKAEAKIGDTKAEIKIDAPEIPSAIGRDSKAELKLATDLLGKQVTTKDGDDFGKVSDLLVDMKAAKVPFAIISTGTLLKPGDTRYAVALQNLTQLNTRDKVALNIDRASLEQAEAFDHEKWQTTGKTSGSAGVFKYEDKEGSLKAGAKVDVDTKSDATAQVKTSADANTGALALLKEGNRYVGEQAKDKVVQIRSEKSLNGLTPSVWYVVFYDPTAALKATEVKFVNGKMADVKRPLRLLEATSRVEPLDTTKVKIDSDKALDIAKTQPTLENAKLTASEMRLERGEAGLSVWRIQLFASKAADATGDISLGHVTLSAEDGKVLKTDLKTQ